MRRAVAPVVVVLAALAVAPSAQSPSAPVPVIGSRAIPVLTIGGRRFRDLNRTGSLDAYEDWRQPAETRVDDLLARMSLEEKAGTMMHGTAPAPVLGPGAPGEEAAAIVGALGASDAALLDVVTGRARAEGHFPFALPRSMADVEAQSPGRPHDSASPLYPFGWPR